MEKISVNALVDSYKNDLPREIQLEIAKSILVGSLGKAEALREFVEKIDSFSALPPIIDETCTGRIAKVFEELGK